MDADKEIMKATDYYDGEKYLPAIKVCNSIIAFDPTYERAYFERAMAYLGLDNHSMALKDFEKLMAINPKYPGLRNWYSLTLRDTKNYLKAARVKIEELKEFPEGIHAMGVSPLGWADCAENFYKAGLVDTAISVLEEYFETYSRKVTIYKMDETTPLSIYARLMIEKKDLKKALAVAEQAMESAHKTPRDYELWIEVNILNGNYNKAQEVLRYYVSEIQGGYETDNVKRLKKMMK